jgi:alpha-galactosidase
MLLFIVVMQVTGCLSDLNDHNGQIIVGNHGRAWTTDIGNHRRREQDQGNFKISPSFTKAQNKRQECIRRQKYAWPLLLLAFAIMLPLTLLTAPILDIAIPGPGGVGKLPALGWNSWNAYGCNINEQRFVDAAHLMISIGLADAGYEYVNIDDCWSEMSRDQTTGRLKPDLSKFPDGINGTAEKIHAMGLKIGIYSSAGTKTCAGYPASLGHEDIDAHTWADWGIDYLKYDNCNVPEEWQDECEWCVVDLDNHKTFIPEPNGTCPADGGNWCPDGYDFNRSRTAERYRRMRNAIDRTERPMLYSLCEWGSANVQTWGANVAQSWRSTGDIFRKLHLVNGP